MIFAGWTLPGSSFAVQSYLNSAYFGRPLPFGQTLIVWLGCVYIRALLTPFIIHLSRRFPVERGTYLRGVAVHLCVGALVSLLQ